MVSFLVVYFSWISSGGLKKIRWYYLCRKGICGEVPSFYGPPNHPFIHCSTAGWWFQCTKYSTKTRDHHSHVIVIIVHWSYGKWHASSDAVSFFASFCTVSWMTDATQLIFIRCHREHFETIDFTDINRIGSLFQRKTINNQPEISRWPRGPRNTAVKAKLCVYNVFASRYPWFLTAFLVILSVIASR